MRKSFSILQVKLPTLKNALVSLLSSPDRGVVSGGPRYEKSRETTGVNSEMAEPIAMKLSEIDRGVCAHVFGQKN